MPETANAALRIPKACQECRKRKIRCNGLNPCKACQQRNASCVYRELTRSRRGKREYQEARRNDDAAPKGPSSHPAERNPPTLRDFPNSVSATHMASPSCQIQLYYGPTSHFSLMQHIYRDFIANPTTQSETPSGQVEEAGAGLDLFSFRRIFFGTPDTHDGGDKGRGFGDMPLMFLPYGLAKWFLSRYLSTLHQLMPYRSHIDFEEWLDQLYHPSPDLYPDTLSRAIFLLALAIGSLGTVHYAWGDVLFERVKTSLTAFDDLVNLQTVQISLMMISSTWASLSPEVTDTSFINTPIFKANKDVRIQHSCISAVLFARPIQWVYIRKHIVITCGVKRTLKSDGLPFGAFTFLKRTPFCDLISSFFFSL